ncbi:Gfo/Idh/MocA family oxidoreductase [Tetragenococcus halophilus]|nr:Gfo/Idh/MocA family oxidoreductase [Tetragenococcus halophilus]
MALCVPVEENLQSAQAELEVKYLYKDYHDALANDEIDAVIIVTSTACHKEIAIAAAKANR